ncbi:TetR/AcrR family transcriptional regulator [Georgenia wangjunii]|uniref:TetR/AcrR family transcriptional regulator n=1 Tax=Georgenia wangjunii TaxID=3117730 RepID=UPI002F26BDDE
MYRRAEGSQDPRTIRSRKLLQDALLAILRTAPDEPVTVAQLTEHAGVNRSTFYQHYRDVDALLADALDSRALAAGADVTSIPPEALAGDEPPATLVAYFEHIAENHEVYRLSLGEKGSPATLVRLRNRIAELMAEGLQRHSTPEASSAPPPVVAAAMAGSLLGVMTCWVERMPEVPAHDAATWAWQALLATPNAYRA